jgi:hypothetical protein
MPNEILTTQQMVDASSVLLESRLILAGALDHKTEDKFVKGAGNTVSVRTIASLKPAGDLNEDGEAATDSLAETKVDVKIEKQFYKSVELTAEDMTLNIEDFSSQVLEPIINSLVASIETYTNAKLAANAGGKTGSSYAAPTTLADCARANRWFTDHKIIPQGRFAFIGSESEEAFIQLDAFTAATYGADGPIALRDATIGKRLGMNFVVNPYATVVAAIPGTLTVKTETNPGAKSISVAGITAGTKIPAGAAITIDGVQYFVAEAIKSANATEQPVKLSVGLKKKAAAGAAVTASAYTQSFIAHKSCAAIAIIAPEPSQGAPSAIASHRGISVRATRVFDSKKLKDVLTLDVLVGMRVLHPEACALFTAK